MNPSTTATMFSSASVEWSTPQDFFDELDEEFRFTLDAAANFDNKKCPVYIAEDSLSVSWLWDVDRAEDATMRGAVYVNPPYGRGIGDWVAKAAETAKQGRTVVMLLPARTDTRYFHEHIWSGSRPKPGVEVRFVPGRLKFGGHKNSAPFPSVVVIFHGSNPPSDLGAP